MEYKNIISLEKLCNLASSRLFAASKYVFINSLQARMKVCLCSEFYTQHVSVRVQNTSKQAESVGSELYSNK